VWKLSKKRLNTNSHVGGRNSVVWIEKSGSLTSDGTHISSVYIMGCTSNKGAYLSERGKH